MAGFYLAPIVVVDAEGTHLKIIGINCTDEDYAEWLKENRLMHPYLIPDFFLKAYLEHRGITIEQVDGGFMGKPKQGNDNIEGNVLLYRTDINQREVFIDVKRVKEILEKFKLPYNEFIDRYGIYLKNLTLPLSEIFKS